MQYIDELMFGPCMLRLLLVMYRVHKTPFAALVTANTVLP